jgi:hypothetical protein
LKSLVSKLSKLPKLPKRVYLAYDFALDERDEYASAIPILLSTNM